MKNVDNKAITYKEIKVKQKSDINSRLTRNMIYRKFSTPFTYLFVKIGISAPTVSILNFFPLFIGYYFLSAGTRYKMIAGILFFVLYRTLDCSDGEVARIQNSRAMEGKYRSMEGAYFDAVVHLISPICLGMGFGIGMYHLYNSEWYFIFGVVLSILFSFEFGLIELAKAYFRRGIIDRKIKVNKSDKEYQNDFGEMLNEGHSLSNRNIFIKLFGIYPLQGWVYLVEFLLPISIIIILVEPFIVNSLYFNPTGFGLLSLYLMSVVLVKLIWTFSFICRMKEKKYITKFLDGLDYK